MSSSVLSLEGISKRFGHLLALQDVNLDIAEGEIHALLGENGAGKSTLMNIVFGLLQPDSGNIRLDGRRINHMVPQKAMSLGIGMVHQHFMLIDEFTVAENVALGSPGWKEALGSSAGSRLSHLMSETGLVVNPSARAHDLPVGIKQRVEILKALFRGAKLLILDEPTAVLAPQETEDLFRSLYKLRDQGTSIIIITHKLREALSVSSKITVLRHGSVVLCEDTYRVSELQVSQAMVGRSIEERTKELQTPSDPVPLMSVTDLSYVPGSGSPVTRISFDVSAGEILAIAGVEGNGQNALIDCLTGLCSPDSGCISLGNQDITHCSVADRLRLSISHIPGDRQKEGLLLTSTLQDNVLLGRWPLREYRRGPWINERSLNEATRSILTQYAISGASEGTAAEALSGGNQQRLIVGRQLGIRPDVLIAVNPTRGLDVSATEYVHSQMLDHRARGGAVILISTDLDETMHLADRIVVIYGGRLVKSLSMTPTRSQIGLAMTTGSGVPS